MIAYLLANDQDLAQALKIAAPVNQANTTCLRLTLVAVSAVAPFVTTPIATAAAPGAVGQKVPDGNQDDSSEQGFNNRNTFKDRIAGNNHLDHVSEQPDAREGRNNSADKAKGQ